MPKRNHFLKEAFWQGLRECDTDYLRQKCTELVNTEEERLQQVISPSLVASTCRLQRLKRFLGHQAQPGLTHMAVRRGEPDTVSQMNFIRGFQMEGLIVACLQHSLRDRFIASAPQFHVDWKDPVTGHHFAGHPDVLLEDEDGQLALVQIKTPSVFKLDRIEKKGDQDALETYWPQMATELYITRKAGIPVARNYLFMTTWEATPKLNDPRVLVIRSDWDPSGDAMVETVADEVYADWAGVEEDGIWPEALPDRMWDSFPCSYCNFPRRGDGMLKVGCEENEAWQLHAEGKPWQPLERATAKADNIVPLTGFERRPDGHYQKVMDLG